MNKLEKEQLQTFSEDAIKELAARLLRKVIKLTPVGESVTEIVGTGQYYKRGEKKGQEKTKKKTIRHGGTLRRGWTSKTQQEAEKGTGNGRSVDDFLDSVSVKKQGSSYVIEIVNPVKYASYVEYGHRQKPGRYVPAIGKKLKQGWVRGRFMMTISEQELNADAPKILEKKLTKFLGDVFDA